MMQLGSKLIAHKRIAACWAWELPLVPPDWSHGIPFVHEIWTPSAFTASAIQPIAAGRPVPVIPYPVALDRVPLKRVARTSADPFTVLTIFNVSSSFARKNPCAAIAAFRLAFGDDPKTRLIVKLANPSSYPASLDLIDDAAGGAPNITVIDRTFNALEIDLLYKKSDALISLHRSEGFGLTLAEAMLHGLPVVATDWSGNADFLTTQTGLPVPYTLISANDPQGSYDHPAMTWADADIPAAAHALTRLRNDPAFAAQLGHDAARFALDTWSPSRYVAAVRTQLGL
jgi:glycosyltransferase involved in cell wall biosynthesis